MKCTTTSQYLQGLIGSGETLRDPVVVDSGDNSYEVYPIAPHEPDKTGNTVLWHVPKSTERIHVLGSMTMRMHAVAGRGEVVVYDNRGERHIHEVAPGIGSLAIREGETYYMVSTNAREPLTVRDRAEPPYKPGDEVSLAEVTRAEMRLHTGDKFLIWNPRQPGNVETAGAWWLTVHDEHDTTAYNQARAGQAKFYGEPSHWHASAQRVGQNEAWPVNVRMVEGGPEVLPHKRGYSATSGDMPTFIVQEDAMILLAMQDTTE